MSRVGTASVGRLAADRPSFTTAGKADARFAQLDRPLVECAADGPMPLAAPPVHASPPARSAAARSTAGQGRPAAVATQGARVLRVAGTPVALPAAIVKAAPAVVTKVAKRLEAATGSRATSPGRRAESAQELKDTRLMLQIGLALGLSYLAFLVLWLWGTRFRPRVHRGARI